MRRVTRLCGLCIGAVAVAVAAGCSSSGKSASSGGGTYTIPAIMSLTGSASVVGDPEHATLVALQDYVNAHGGVHGDKIAFEFQDNQSDPARAASIGAEDVAKHPAFILNGNLAAADVGVDQLATSSGPVIYDLSSADQAPPHSYIFTATQSVGDQIDGCLRYFKVAGHDRVATLVSNDTTGQHVAAALHRLLGGSDPALAGLTLAASETFDTTSLDATPQAVKIAAAHPQAIFMGATGSPVSVALKSLQSQGLSSVPVCSIDSNDNPTELEHLASILPSEFIVPAFLWQSNTATLPAGARSAVNQYTAAMAAAKSPPTPIGSGIWDAANILIDALRHLSLQATPAQVKAYIEGLHDYQGILGVYHFSGTDHSGIGVNGLVAVKWDPATKGFGTLSTPGMTALVTSGQS